MVVLDELLILGDAGLGVPLPAVCLDKEAALVAKDRGRDQDGARDAGWEYLHWGS